MSAEKQGGYVFPFAVVLLNSLAFSIAALPAKERRCELSIMGSEGRRERRRVGRTLLDQIALVIDDTDILFGEIPDRFVSHFP